MANNDFSMVLAPQDYAKLQMALTQLSKIEQEAVIAKGLSEGVSIIVREGKKNLKSSGTKVRKGNLSSSFTRKVIKKKVKAYGGFQRPKGAAAHLIDRGTVDRYTKKGAYRGKVKGNLFWTKAFEAKKDKAEQTLAESINISINRIIKRNQ